MKALLHAYAMCQSMFCALPCPWKLWDEKARYKMLLFLPLIGLEIGCLWVGLAWLCGKLCLSPLLRALLLSVFPHAVTGFLHLDGFLDVTDAVKSCRDLPRRQEILKDSHVGAFAVIGCVLLLLSQFTLFASASEAANFRILLLIPVVSRCCAALAVTSLRPMSTSQYATMKKPISHICALSLFLLTAIAGGFLFCEKYGFALVGCLIGYGLALCRGFRSLDGMNGDISGYALTVGELCAVAVYALI